MAPTARRPKHAKPQAARPSKIDLNDSLIGLPPLCTAEQLAQRLQVSTDYLYRLAQNAETGKLPGIETLRFGRKRMFPRTAVAAWLESCRANTDYERAQSVVTEELERLRSVIR